jgi:hypothetical protein
MLLMRSHARAVVTGVAVAAGLALVLPAALAQAAETHQPGMFHAGVPAAALAAPAAAVPQTAKLLYSQNNHGAPGWSVGSVNWGKGNTDDNQAADDFTVPKGHTWAITKVKVTGAPTSGTPTSENVFFYKNKVNTKKQDVPGALVKKQKLKGKDSSGSLVITGIKGVALAAGHYWLSVQANIPSGEVWYWNARTVLNGSPAVWRNPGNGVGAGCTAWTPWYVCAGASPTSPDLMFALYGSKS